MSYVLGPDEVDDFGRDWRGKSHALPNAKSDWLEDGETVTAHTVTATTGVTIDSHAEDDGLVTARLSHGVLDSDPVVTFHITTSAGRQSERSFTVFVRNR